MRTSAAPAERHVPDYAGQGRLVDNLVHFARVLRTAGIPVGPGQVLKAIEAVRAVDITDRAQFYWALHAALVNRRDQREVFDQAFHMFWRRPDYLERMLAMVLPTVETEASPEEARAQIGRRVADAFRGMTETETRAEPEVEVHAEMTWSDRELLHRMDFESMSAEEAALAKRVMASMALPLRDLPTRRFQPKPAGARADMRATLRALLRSGGDVIPLKRKQRVRRSPPLVVICDISGSMARYSRMLLHFLHALTNDRDRVHVFLFGTRLSNVTRALRQRDVDVAVEKVSDQVEDWSGGTRLGHCLHTFNHDWSRRVLGQGATVLLITDGLDRDAGAGLGREMERLHKSCRRLIWLNPLLRWEGFEPKSSGARAILPHVDELRAVHNLESLAGLADALSKPPPSGRGEMERWLKRT